MKKLFFASLWALACLVVACSDEKDEPNDESGSIVGEWVFQRNEYYRKGKLVDSFTAVEEEDKAIAIFREDGTYRYYVCLTEITVSTMKWIYDEGDGEVLVEYYSRK